MGAWRLILVGASICAAANCAHVRRSARDVRFIPNTTVEMPDDYGDYSRGRTPIALFPDEARTPGHRSPAFSPGPGLPRFTANRTTSSEQFIEASPLDKIGGKCAPGGRPAGHYFYNVYDPELVPFIVDRNDLSRTDAAVVVCPGGGNVHLSWEPSGVAAAEWLNSLGISAFVLKYRVPCEDGGNIQVMDAQRSLSIVRHSASKYGFNASRIGLMGASAGAMLSHKVISNPTRLYDRIDAVDDVSFRPDFLILLYGVNPMTLFNKQVYQAMPPTMAFFSQVDPCMVPLMTKPFMDSMERWSEAPHLLHMFPDGGHAWCDCNYYPIIKGSKACGWTELAKPFIQTNVLHMN